MRWTFFLTPPATAAYNMALDEALMRRASRTGGAVFRVYSWSAPTVSLGRNQRARNCYDLDRAAARGIRFVRRPTGGRALLHDHEVTYSATLPLARTGDASDAYEFVNDVLLAALARLGVNAGRAMETVAIAPGLRPCFDVPAAREIAVDGRKLVGSAQWRHDGALLQHGSILICDDQPRIAELLLAPAASPSTSAATLSQALGYHPCIEDVAQPILQSLEEATASAVDALVPDGDLAADVAELQRSYEDDAWTWRR